MKVLILFTSLLFLSTTNAFAVKADRFNQKISQKVALIQKTLENFDKKLQQQVYRSLVSKEDRKQFKVVVSRLQMKSAKIMTLGPFILINNQKRSDIYEITSLRPLKIKTNFGKAKTIIPGHLNRGLYKVKTAGLIETFFKHILPRASAKETEYSTTILKSAADWEFLIRAVAHHYPLKGLPEIALGPNIDFKMIGLQVAILLDNLKIEQIRCGSKPDSSDITGDYQSSSLDKNYASRRDFFMKRRGENDWIAVGCKLETDPPGCFFMRDYFWKNETQKFTRGRPDNPRPQPDELVKLIGKQVLAQAKRPFKLHDGSVIDNDNIELSCHLKSKDLEWSDLNKNQPVDGLKDTINSPLSLTYAPPADYRDRVLKCSQQTSLLLFS